MEEELCAIVVEEARSCEPSHGRRHVLHHRRPGFDHCSIRAARTTANLRDRRSRSGARPKPYLCIADRKGESPIVVIRRTRLCRPISFGDDED